MNQTQVNSDNPSLQDDNTRILLMGLGLGAVVGLVSSYLYTRTASENQNADGGKAKSVSTGQLLGIMLTILGLVRQIADLGKPPKSGKTNKK